jgi:hypothetical protein
MFYSVALAPEPLDLAEMFEPAILILERVHLGDVADLKATVLGLPFVEGLRADAMLAAQLFRIRAGFGFFDDADDLCFGEAGLSQGGFLSRPEPQDFCLEKRTTLMGTRQAVDLICRCQRAFDRAVVVGGDGDHAYALKVAKSLCPDIQVWVMPSSPLPDCVRPVLWYSIWNFPTF